MSRKKSKYYYVLVFSNEGPIYVTYVNRNNKYAHWNKNKPPMEFNKHSAKDLALGLNMNFTSAVVVVSPVEITGQPYRYEEFDVKFERREKDGEEEQDK